VSSQEPYVQALARTLEALLLLSSDPLTPAELADATQAPEDAVRAALAELAQQYASRSPAIPTPRRRRADC